ncbi:MAG: collagen-like protein [Proteobacteria bacterium]|nr:collagen-like protein [Pseudomonadota bacterium]
MSTYELAGGDSKWGNINNWLLTVQGAPGPQGIQGPAGPTGPAGKDGSAADLAAYSTTTETNSMITTAITNALTDVTGLINDKLLASQSDWDQISAADPSYIKNKPAIPTTSDITSLIASALAPYSTTAETTTIINDAIAGVLATKNYTTTSDVTNLIASALTDYSTTAEVNNLIANSFADVANAATDVKYGVVKLGSATAQTDAANAVTATTGRTYAVQKNAAGQMVVNVPWTSTAAQIQSDWDQALDTASDYIKNKPTILTSADVANLIASALAAGDFITNTEANTLVADALTSYSTTSETNILITNAITSALNSYSTTAQVNTLITNQFSDIANAATDVKLGTVKLGSATAQTVAAETPSATAARTYAVQTNAAGQMVVNVPWTSTAAQIQSDWEQSLDTAPDYIKNKPTILSNTDVTNLIAGALASYSTTSETNTLITDAITSALNSYSTTAQVNTLITNQFSNIANAATSAKLGTVKLGSDTVQAVAAVAMPTAVAGQTYPVQLNAAGQMVVNVPWAGAELTPATNVALGGIKLAQPADAAAATLAADTTTGQNIRVKLDSAGVAYVNVAPGAQADWAQTLDTDPSYIQNKPTIPTVGTAAGNVPSNGAALGTTANNLVATNSSGKLIPTGVTSDTLVLTAAGTYDMTAGVYNVATPPLP